MERSIFKKHNMNLDKIYLLAKIIISWPLFMPLYNLFFTEHSITIFTLLRVLYEGIEGHGASQHGQLHYWKLYNYQRRSICLANMEKPQTVKSRSN